MFIVADESIKVTMCSTQISHTSDCSGLFAVLVIRCLGKLPYFPMALLNPNAHNIPCWIVWAPLASEGWVHEMQPLS